MRIEENLVGLSLGPSITYDLLHQKQRSTLAGSGPEKQISQHAEEEASVTVCIFTKDINAKHVRTCFSHLSSVPQSLYIVVLEKNHILHTMKKRGNDPELVHLRSEITYPKASDFNFARACNLVAERLNTEWTLLLNDDCFVYPNCISEMLRVSEKTNAGIVGAKLLDPAGSIQHRGIYVDSQPSIIRHYTTDSEDLYTEHPLGVSAACMLVRTDILKKLRYDEGFQFAYEDVDFCVRAKKSGLKIVVANKATAVHLGSRSSRTFRCSIKKSASALRLFAKHPELSGNHRFKILLYYGMWLLTLTYPLRIKLRHSFPHLFASLRHARNLLFGMNKWMSSSEIKNSRYWDIGGGISPTPGYVNVDVLKAADLRHNVLEPFPNRYHNTVLKAKFNHGPEHYTVEELPSVLANIYEVLAPGGELDIRCPDMDYLCKRWFEDEDSKYDCLRNIFGSHENLYQIHKSGWNFKYLERQLRLAGFMDIRRIDPAGLERYTDSNRIHDLRVVCYKPRK